MSLCGGELSHMVNAWDAVEAPEAMISPPYPELLWLRYPRLAIVADQFWHWVDNPEFDTSVLRPNWDRCWLIRLITSARSSQLVGAAVVGAGVGVDFVGLGEGVVGVGLGLAGEVGVADARLGEGLGVDVGLGGFVGVHFDPGLCVGDVEVAGAGLLEAADGEGVADTRALFDDGISFGVWTGAATVGVGLALPWGTA